MSILDKFSQTQEQQRTYFRVDDFSKDALYLYTITEVGQEKIAGKDVLMLKFDNETKGYPLNTFSKVKKVAEMFDNEDETAWTGEKIVLFRTSFYNDRENKNIEFVDVRGYEPALFDIYTKPETMPDGAPETTGDVLPNGLPVPDLSKLTDEDIPF